MQYPVLLYLLKFAQQQPASPHLTHAHMHILIFQLHVRVSAVSGQVLSMANKLRTAASVPDPVAATGTGYSLYSGTVPLNTCARHLMHVLMVP